MSSLEQHLHQHSRALRALARDLVGDHYAEDLIQDAVLETLRAPPPRPGPLGGWFAQVLRHLASKHRRSIRRRREREALALRDRTVVAPDRQVDAAEQFRKLNEAVLSLPAAYRDAILRRKVLRQV